jgi:hypothetical protein
MRLLCPGKVSIGKVSFIHRGKPLAFFNLLKCENVDQLTVNQWVVGSIPTFGAIFIEEALQIMNLLGFFASERE